MLPESVKKLQATDWLVRWEATVELGESKDPGAAKPLASALRNPAEDVSVRAAAAKALGEIGIPWVVEPLREALANESLEVRRAAALALGKVADRRAAKALEATLMDRYSSVRGAAAWALEQMGWQPGDPIQSGLYHCSLHEHRLLSLDTDEPLCTSCGLPLGDPQSIFETGEAEILSERTAAKKAIDYLLFPGSVCLRCLEVLCLSCLGEHVEECSKCRGETLPAYRQHLRKLHELALNWDEEERSARRKS